MKLLCALCGLLLLLALRLDAQTQYPPLPNGLRIIVGGSGVMARTAPSSTASCGEPPHPCTTADVIPPNIYGVIQPDAPVHDAAGWYWHRITYAYAGGITGWSSAYPPFVNSLQPPQMTQGVAMSIVSDYVGPALTQGICINDGVNSGASLSLQPQVGGTVGWVQGTILCGWGMPGVGNHKAVVKAINAAGTMDSTEFQFAVTTAPVQSPPSQPSNLRIAPAAGTTATRLP